jgi:hypothetical protein
MTLNQEEIAFYAQLGITFSQWARVEQRLFLVVARCVSNPDRPMLYAGLFSIQGFRSKLSFCDKLMCSKFGDNNRHIADWSTIQNRLSKLSGERNKIAHGLVIMYILGKPGRRIGITPLDDDGKKPQPRKGGAPSYAICLRDLSRIYYEFLALTQTLENFSERLVGRVERFPQSDEQPKSALSLAQIKRRFLESL